MNTLIVVVNDCQVLGIGNLMSYSVVLSSVQTKFFNFSCSPVELEKGKDMLTKAID